MDHRAQIDVVESDLTVEHVLFWGGKMLWKTWRWMMSNFHPGLPETGYLKELGNEDRSVSPCFPLCRPYGSRFAESSRWQIRWLYLLEGLSQRCDCGPGLSFLFWNVPIHAYSLKDSFNMFVLDDIMILVNVEIIWALSFMLVLVGWSHWISERVCWVLIMSAAYIIII